MDTLTENLSRARLDADAAEVRAEGDGRTLFGHFSVFNSWYEVNSRWEGHFMERVVPGAFQRTLTERRSQIKALYDHGADPQLGNKPLGSFTQLREDAKGGMYEIALIDTDYNRDFIIPAAKAGLLGASFRFSVADDGQQWDDNPTRSVHNPEGLPERSITDANVFELGPVTFPASAAATAAVRSDEFFDRLLNDPLFLARFTERVGAGVVEKALAALPPDGRSTHSNTPPPSPDGHVEEHTGRSLAACLTDIERLRRHTHEVSGDPASQAR